jgi:hypothetical protein
MIHVMESTIAVVSSVTPHLDADRVNHLITAMKLVGAGSASMVSTGLAIIAGSIATIVSTSYLRPTISNVRLIYLLYLPGWAFIGTSIYYGDTIARRGIAAHFVDSNQLETIAALLNTDYQCQRNLLALGLGAFGIWLVLFLFWWVFGKWTIAKNGD